MVTDPDQNWPQNETEHCPDPVVDEEKQMNGTGPNGLFSITEYAAHRGLSDRAIRKALEKGQISYFEYEGRKFIDKDKADREWAKNRAPKYGSVPTDHMQPLFDTEAPKEEPKLVVTAAAEEESKGSAKSSLVNAKAMREEYMAKLARLEFEERAGLLINREVHLKFMEEKNAEVLRNLKSISVKIQGRLAAETDPFKIGQIIDCEIDRALANLSDNIMLH